MSWGFPGGSAGKESACNVGDPGFDPWVGKIVVHLQISFFKLH